MAHYLLILATESEKERETKGRTQIAHARPMSSVDTEKMFIKGADCHRFHLFLFTYSASVSPLLLPLPRLLFLFPAFLVFQGLWVQLAHEAGQRVCWGCHAPSNKQCWSIVLRRLEPGTDQIRKYMTCQLMSWVTEYSQFWNLRFIWWIIHRKIVSIL